VRRRALVALVFLVAGAVLAESWHAAMNAAATGGRPWPWLWPATLEAFIFVLVLVYWDARATGRSAPAARGMLLLVTEVAACVQALDAPPTWLGWLTAAWTPNALLLTVEYATWLLYGAPTRGGAGAGADAPAPPPTDEPVVRLHDAPPRAPALAPVLAPADTRARAAHPAGRTYRTLTPAERRKAERELARDPEVSARQLAARTGIAYAPVRAFLRSRELAPSRNGSRP
jgi:hypothetical protein